MPRGIMTRVLAPMAALFISAAPLLAQAADRDVKAILPEFEKTVTAGMRQTGVPGVAIVIVHRDEVVYLKGFGVRKIGADARVDADTLFQLASVSKPIATTALAALVGEGRLSWDDPVIKHFPQFQMSDPWVTREVTLRDFLCHRSGLPAFAGDLLEDLGYERRDILARLRFITPATSFRSGYAYTNFGFTAAAEAGARAAGKEWEDLVADKVYRPLGMKSTSSRFADFARAENRAVLHVREGERMVAKYVRQPDAQSPAGGVSTSARDLAQWMRLQLADGKFEGKQLIPAAALGETHRPHMVTGFNPATFGKAGFYALGWGVTYDDDGLVYLKHSGAFSLGVRTEVALLPKENLGIAVLANAFPTGLPEGLSASFFDLYLHGKLGKDHVSFTEKMFLEAMKQMEGPHRDYSKRPARPSPALPAARYAGQYRNDLFGTVEVVANGDNLRVVVGPKKTTFTLKHWDRDVFTYEPAGESATGTSAAVFRIGGDGHADQLLMESLNDYQSGTFARVPPKK
jgi:CubicO group peptidase (beta-lactamase class C family)